MTARRTGLALMVGLALAVAAGGALAKTVAEVIAERQAGYKQMGGAFKAIADETKKDAPDMALILKSATTVNTISKKIPHWFPKGSGPESGVKTKALPEIWTDWKTFAAADKNLQAQSAKLMTLAKAGDVAGVKGQFGATGGACKSCHDKFRGK